MRTIAHSLLSLTGIALTAVSLVNCSGEDGCAGFCDTGGMPGSAGGESGQGGTSGQGGSSGGSASGGDGGTSGASESGAGGEAGSGGNACDATRSPNEESCLVDSEYAIFVAPTGDDGATGTKAAPVATLTKAVELAAASDKIVLVCNAEYDERVEIASGARVYGGFACSDWSVDAGKPLFKPSDAGAALKIDGVDDEVLIEGVDFEVPDASGAGASAVAAIVNEASDVTLHAVTLVAGAGQDGVSPTNEEYTFPTALELQGSDGTLTDGGPSGSECACPDGSTSKRGAGGASPDGGGSSGLPNHDGPGGEGGDEDLSCGSGGSGLDGAAGPTAGGASGAAIFGSILNAAWAPANGTDGAPGSPGQGGGGGAGKTAGGGGSGGCGGCGGKGGLGGRGGGASIGLLVMNSLVHLESSTIETANAGDGGNGAAGQQGQTVGGFSGDGFADGCDGGQGGPGGDGAAGGGGAGGVSAGIVWQGDTAPVVSDDTTIVLGEAGLPGEGGAGTNDGVAGVAQETLEL